MAVTDYNKKELHAKIIGTTIYDLYIKDLYYDNYTPFFNYRCLICGHEAKITWHCISKKTNNGCWICNNRKNACTRWGGYEEISKTYFENLNRRNKEFTVTIEYIWDVFISQSRLCALSGIPLKFATTTQIRDGNASLDRIDNNYGYIPGNVRWVDKHINMMRRKLSDNDFIWFCAEVAKSNKERELITPNVSKTMEW